MVERRKIEKEFKEIEKKLVKLLKSASLKFSESDDEETTKENIKNHIDKVLQAKALFEEYESLAKKLQNFDDEDDKVELSKSDEPVILKTPQKKDCEKDKKNNIAAKQKKKSNKVELEKML